MVSSKEQRTKIKMGRTGFKACEGRSSDTHKLSDTAKSVNLPSPSINDLIMHYGGDKYKAAYELTREELGSTGTVEQYKRTYKNMLHNINRYLSKERTPSSEMKQRFQKSYQPESINSLKVRIRGCVKVSETYYYKDSTWNNPIVVPANDVNTFIKLARENNNAGYSYLNGIYMKSGIVDDTFSWLDNVEINMSF